MVKPRPTASLSQVFKGAAESQAVSGLKDQIAELQAEITRLRSSGASDEEQEALVNQLTDELKGKGGEHLISIDLIDPDPSQPRTIFPKEVILGRAKSLKEDGQLVPIIVTPKEVNGDVRYSIFEGNVRWLAAPIAGLPHLRCVFLSEEQRTDSLEIFEKQLVTSIQSEKLHPYDLARAFIRLIVGQFPELVGRELEIPSILNGAIQRLKRAKRLSELTQLKSKDAATQREWVENCPEIKSEEERHIILTILGKVISPIVINNDVFPLLKLPPEVLGFLKEGMESRKAKELNRLTAQSLNCTEAEAIAIRQQIGNQILNEKLDRDEVSALVAQTLLEYSGQNNPETEAKKLYLARFKIVSQVAKRADWSKPELQSLLEQLELALGIAND
jgi:ParB family transcriptional regulator, chromosome partitioning protein